MFNTNSQAVLSTIAMMEGNFAYMKLESGCTVDVTSQQEMLTPPRHLIPHAVCLVVCVFYSYVYFDTDHCLVSWPFHFIRMGNFR
jgi:hypothetical protein